MKTKLVYVLTCKQDNTYLEQTHISLYSARYHNPDAHIVLIVDRPTDALFVGHRADILQYVSEKIVADVPSDFNTMQTSRWLKTSVRNMIDGDFLFIDSDTIVAKPLDETDSFTCQIGGVLDCHRPVSQFKEQEVVNLIQNAAKCGWDYTQVEDYFSSGVLYVKDTKDTRHFYDIWHKNYLYTSKCGINIDQISFERTKQELPIVNYIPDTWNTIMFIRPTFITDAYIIHFCSLNNNSFLFSKRVLNCIRQNGLSEYITKYILEPTHSFLPYLPSAFKGGELLRTRHWLAIALKEYAENIDPDFIDWKINSRINGLVHHALKCKLFTFSAILWLTWAMMTGKHNNIGKYYAKS